MPRGDGVRRLHRTVGAARAEGRGPGRGIGAGRSGVCAVGVGADRLCVERRHAPGDLEPGRELDDFGPERNRRDAYVWAIEPELPH
jgi:hypothetical protein